MSRSKITTRKFVFISESTVKRDYYAISAWQSAQLRKKLLKHIFLTQIQAKGSIQWNIVLLQAYMSYGEGDQLNALIEEFYGTLPKAG